MGRGKERLEREVCEGEEGSIRTGDKQERCGGGTEGKGRTSKEWKTEMKKCVKVKRKKEGRERKQKKKVWMWYLVCRKKEKKKAGNKRKEHKR